jgi:hypothetical protein
MLKYEDMIADFSAWLENLWTCCQLQISDSLKMTFIAEKKKHKKRKKEDIITHVRQVTPGDHLRKLKPETVEYLNKCYKGVMEYFEYPIDIRSTSFRTNRHLPKTGKHRARNISSQWHPQVALSHFNKKTQGSLG